MFKMQHLPCCSF